MELARRLDVAGWISLGAIPAAVPHTRPVTVLGTESRPGLLRGDVPPGPDGVLRVPAAAISVLDLAVAASGIPAVGYYAQVPHYVTGGYPPASVELLRLVGRHLDHEVAADELRDEARRMLARLDAATAGDANTRAHVERLEAMVDEARRPAGRRPDHRDRAVPPRAGARRRPLLIGAAAAPDRDGGRSALQERRDAAAVDSLPGELGPDAARERDERVAVEPLEDERREGGRDPRPGRRTRLRRRPGRGGPAGRSRRWGAGGPLPPGSGARTPRRSWAAGAGRPAGTGRGRGRRRPAPGAPRPGRRRPAPGRGRAGGRGARRGTCRSPGRAGRGAR